MQSSTISPDASLRSNNAAALDCAAAANDDVVRSTFGAGAQGKLKICNVHVLRTLTDRVLSRDTDMPTDLAIPHNRARGRAKPDAAAGWVCIFDKQSLEDNSSGRVVGRRQVTIKNIAADISGNVNSGSIAQE